MIAKRIVTEFFEVLDELHTDPQRRAVHAISEAMDRAPGGTGWEVVRDDGTYVRVKHVEEGSAQ